jgi:hypothetical protein
MRTAEGGIDGRRHDVIRYDAEISGEQINEAFAEQRRSDQQDNGGAELRNTEQLL